MAHAMNSFKLLAGTDGCTAITLVATVMRDADGEAKLRPGGVSKPRLMALVMVMLPMAG